MNLILASASPRRKELLAGLGLSFEVFVSEADESFLPGTAATAIPEMLAIRKAQAVSMLRPDCLIIAADTVVEAGGQILNKPAGAAEAMEMLQLLSGKTHFVHTGFCLQGPAGRISGCDSTSVSFRELLFSEMEYYVNTGMAYDKAGSYGIQEWIGLAGVDRIEGSYFTVMGLPTHRIWEGLKQMAFPGLIGVQGNAAGNPAIQF